MDSKTEKLKIEVSPTDFDKIEKIMAETTARFITELPTLIHSRLEGAIAKILGFENSWGGEWKIDHCNGRMTVMSDYISDKARTTAHEAVESLNFKVTKELHEAIKKEYVDQFKSVMRDKIRDHAEKQVQSILAKVTAAETMEIETIGRLPTKKDLANPAYGTKPMEKLIMETLVASKSSIKEEGEE